MKKLFKIMIIVLSSSVAQSAFSKERLVINIQPLLDKYENEAKRNTGIKLNKLIKESENLEVTLKWDYYLKMKWIPGTLEVFYEKIYNPNPTKQEADFSIVEIFETNKHGGWKIYRENFYVLIDENTGIGVARSNLIRSVYLGGCPGNGICKGRFVEGVGVQHAKKTKKIIELIQVAKEQ